MFDEPALTNGLSARHAGNIGRYHVFPTVQTQDVGQHTWNVLRLYIRFFGPPSPEVSVAIVFHDVGELVTGDIPFDAKRANRDLADIAAVVDGISTEHLSKGAWQPNMLDPETAARVKFCDLYEMYEFGVEEIRLGNRHYGARVANKIREELFNILGRVTTETFPTALCNFIGELPLHDEGDL